MADWPYSTAAWQRLRIAKLSENPLCQACEDRGKITPANEVDHVHAIKRGGEAFPPITGLRSLCRPCHSIKTNAEDHPKAMRGCDEDGLPRDPSHPFYGASEPSDDNSVPSDIYPLQGRISVDRGPARGNNLAFSSSDVTANLGSTDNLARDWSV